jgi:HEAT repeat protein
MQRDKLYRMAGSSPRAGFDAAEQWMKDPDPSMRRKAIDVFGDIADAASLMRLRELATDRDSVVAAKAQRVLQARDRR